MSPKVSAGALQYARQHDASRIFCGHTHQALHIEENGIHYYNSGGWVDSRLTYLTIDDRGFASMSLPSMSSISTNTTSELTIVIPAKNEANLIPRLLTSLMNQDYSRMSSTKVFGG